MKGVAPTAAEKDYHDKLISIVGCIVCRNFRGGHNTYSSIHHCVGRTKKGCHMMVLPLCDKHHQIADTQKPKRWISRHGDGKAIFEKTYGREEILISECNEILEASNGYAA